MNSKTSVWRRQTAWVFGDSVNATYLQILVVIGLAIWAGFSASTWMRQTAREWTNLGEFPETIIRTWSLPSQLARDFVVVTAVNPQIGVRTVDPAKTRLGLEEEDFWVMASTKNTHSVFFEPLRDGSVNIHYLVQNPMDSIEWYWMQNYKPPRIDSGPKGHYEARSILTARAKRERLLEVTYYFSRSEEANLARWLGQNTWCGWIVAVLSIVLLYFVAVRPAHLRFSRLIYSPSKK